MQVTNTVTTLPPPTASDDTLAAMANRCLREGVDALPRAGDGLDDADTTTWFMRVFGFAVKAATELCESELMQPFNHPNHALIALLPFQGLAIDDADLQADIRQYYTRLEDAFMSRPIDLPSPMSSGSSYRRQCFYAWLGEGLMHAMTSSAQA